MAKTSDAPDTLLSLVFLCEMMARTLQSPEIRTALMQLFDRARVRLHLAGQRVGVCPQHSNRLALMRDIYGSSLGGVSGKGSVVSVQCPEVRDMYPVCLGFRKSNTVEHVA